MAEIVRRSSMTTTRLFSTRDPGTEQVELRERVWVRSVKAPRLDVSVLRDLVAALDEARIPGRTLVEAAIAEGRVTQLTVEADLDPEQVGGPAPESEPGAAAQG